MKRFKRILLVVEGGTEAGPAVERAVNLGKMNRAQVAAVSVVEKVPDQLARLETEISPTQLQEAAVREGARRLERALAPFKRRGVRIRTKVLTGVPFLEIIKEVLRHKHDLVIKVAQGSGSLRARLFGSTDMHLMRQCPCPVWIVKPAKRRAYDRILAAVDPDPFASENRRALNAKIMDLAFSLAASEKSKLHIVHVWNPYGEPTLGSPRTGFRSALVDELVAEIRREHEQAVEKLMGGYAHKGMAPQVHLLKGNPGELISDLAERKRVDLIVMGTVSRTGLTGFFIGNTAEKVLDRVNCSVLTVKPDGFATPVKL